MNFKAILFDLDYTLFDSETSEREALEKTLISSGIDPFETTIRKYQEINHDLWKLLEREDVTLEHLRVKRFEELLLHLGLNMDPLLLADAYTRNLGICGNFYPQARKVLERLGSETKLGLVTNGVSETQRTRLQIHNFSNHFDAIVVSGEFGIPKPNPAIFQETLNLLNLEANEHVLMVGDSLTSDMAGANISGLSSCWFNPMRNDPPVNSDIDYVIHSLDQLLEINYTDV